MPLAPGFVSCKRVSVSIYAWILYEFRHIYIYIYIYIYTWDALRRLQHKRVPASYRQRKHPQRNHGGKIEGSNTAADPARKVSSSWFWVQKNHRVTKVRLSWFWVLENHRVAKGCLSWSEFSFWVRVQYINIFVVYIHLICVCVCVWVGGCVNTYIYKYIHMYICTIL
jgi:hypothetical protein